MLLDKSFFDLSGHSCNKIGVGPTAFKHQQEKCYRTVGDCLKNQIEDFHNEDVRRGQNPLYFVRRFCKNNEMTAVQRVKNRKVVEEFFSCLVDGALC